MSVNRPLWQRWGLLVLIVISLSTCQPQVVTVVVEATPTLVATTAELEMERKVLKVNAGPGDIPTIDPARADDDISSLQIVEETSVGLTRQDEATAEVGPGMAISWDTAVNADGTMTVTFHLRNDVPWVKWDGSHVVQVMDCQKTPAPRMVTAYDFEYGILRTLAPSTVSDYAYVLNAAIVGAEFYNSGEADGPATVAVNATDNLTLEITFVNAAVYNINIAGMWGAHAQPSWLIEGDDCTESRGDRWTETGFFQGYGPYTLQMWVHDSYLTLAKNPYWPGSEGIPQPKIDEITFYILDETPAFARYEADNLDVSPVPLADIDRVEADAVLSQELVIAPVQCTYYYGFNTSKPFVNNVRVRRTLSMAIDRKGLIDNVIKGNQEPAQWFARPGLAGAPTMESHPDLGVKYDPAAARTLLEEYLAKTGIRVADLGLTLMFNTSTDQQKIAEAIQQMWKEALGVEVELTNKEGKDYLKTLLEDAPQIWQLFWCQDYPDANNFAKEVFASGGRMESATQWHNAAFDGILTQAALEANPAKRVGLYAQAEQILVYEDAVIAPIYWYTRSTVTKPYVTCTSSVLGGLEHFEKWDVAVH